MASCIKLRDSPSQVQNKLGLSDQQFETLKHFARQVHREYCASHPSSQWANTKVVWAAIPEREKLDVIGLLYDQCIKSEPFLPITESGNIARDRKLIEGGCKQRLHQVRRTWRLTNYTRSQREKYRKEDKSGD